MRHVQHRHSQSPARRRDAKIEDTPKTLPWTDKLCHFVRFVCSWEATTGECLKSFASGNSMSEILVHPSERSLAAVGANTSMLIWAMPD
ncbi:MAG: hypothetical protein JWP89_3737 [Schlesneria sp.]|nr:hypothetical protein [Schlesneria sp.]